MKSDQHLRDEEKEILDSEAELIKEERARLTARHELLLPKRLSSDSTGSKSSFLSNEGLRPRKEMKSAFDHSDHSHLHVAFDAKMPHLHELHIKPAEDAVSPVKSENSDGASSISVRGSDSGDELVDMGDESSPSDVPSFAKKTVDSPTKYNEDSIEAQAEEQKPENNDKDPEMPAEEEPETRLRPVSDNKIQHAFHNSRPFRAEVWRYESLTLWADPMRADGMCLFNALVRLTGSCCRDLRRVSLAVVVSDVPNRL